MAASCRRHRPRVVLMLLPIAVSAVLAVVAGVLVSVDAALSSFSKARAEELDDEGRAGAGRLALILKDPAPYLNSVLLMRVLAETSSIVLVALVVADERQRSLAAFRGRCRDHGRRQLRADRCRTSHARPPTCRADRAALHPSRGRAHPAARPSAQAVDSARKRRDPRQGVQRGTIRLRSRGA